MEAVFSADYRWAWTLALAVLLYLPVRQMIWVLSVRRADAKHGETDEAQKLRLKRRAGITAALLCFVFSTFYTAQLFQGAS